VDLFRITVPEIIFEKKGLIPEYSGCLFKLIMLCSSGLLVMLEMIVDF
jgi:hypothetical protein